MPRHLGRTLALVGAGVVVVGGLVWAALPRPVSVEVGAARTGSVVKDVVEDGRVEVIDRYTVSAPLTGTLARPTLRPGDPVNQGQVVAELLPTEAPLLDARSRAQAQATLSAALDARTVAQANLQAAEVASDHAARELKRAEQLGDAIAVVERDRAAAEARLRSEQAASARFAVQVADHEVEQARSLLQRSGGREASEVFAITAPVSGRVLRVYQESAGVVGAGTPLLEVGDPAALEVVVDVLSTDAVRIRPGAPVQVEAWGGPAALPARVRTIEPAAFTRVSALGVEEQRVNTIVALDDPPPPALGDAYRVEARIELDRRDSVLVVPEAAVFRWGTDPAVFRVVDDRALKTRVRLGLRNGAEAEVLDGLTEGDPVVLHPSESVDDGVRVRPFGE